MNEFRAISRVLPAILCAMTLSSCASHAVREQPPFVQINGMKLVEQSLTLDLGVRNVNSEVILIRQTEFYVSLDETELAIYNAASNASIIANGTENVRFELAASPDGIALLHQLEQGELKDLEYSFEGVIELVDGGQLTMKREGHIFPVPGRPGSFR